MITVEGEGGDKEGVKQIFVLDEEMAAAGSHTESVQESKAMTPCFLHTPNMTNKWNDFKPGDNSNQQECLTSNSKQQHRHINHQSNPSEDL